MPIALSYPRKSLLLLPLLLLPLAGTPAATREKDPLRYVITLQTSEQTPEVSGIPLAGHLRTYVTTFQRDGSTLYRLRLGFFASRAAAEQAYSRIRARFPEGWVTRVSKKEKKLVASGEIESSPLVGLAAGN